MNWPTAEEYLKAAARESEDPAFFLKIAAITAREYRYLRCMHISYGGMPNQAVSEPSGVGRMRQTDQCPVKGCVDGQIWVSEAGRPTRYAFHA